MGEIEVHSRQKEKHVMELRGTKNIKFQQHRRVCMALGWGAVEGSGSCSRQEQKQNEEREKGAKDRTRGWGQVVTNPVLLL